MEWDFSSGLRADQFGDILNSICWAVIPFSVFVGVWRSRLTATRHFPCADIINIKVIVRAKCCETVVRVINTLKVFHHFPHRYGFGLEIICRNAKRIRRDNSPKRII